MLLCNFTDQGVVQPVSSLQPTRVRQKNGPGGTTVIATAGAGGGGGIDTTDTEEAPAWGL
jgi:hypothetical protein